MNPTDQPQISDKPKSLYHYTSIHGVEGILNTNSIWATQLHFMNDSTEWLYALDLVRKNIRGRIKQREDRYWLQVIALISDLLKNIEKIDLYVCSFSEVSDQLSQWRAYGGYEISFDVSLLRVLLLRNMFQLQPCIYDFEEQQRIVNGFVEPIINGIGTIADDDSLQVAGRDTLIKLFNRLASVAPVLKHPDFKEEKEWRAFGFLEADDPRLHYHIRGSVIVPHCSLELKVPTAPSPITDIKIGPHPHQSLAVQGLKALTRLSQIGVTASSTPFRTF
jgi:hypothetical protein